MITSLILLVTLIVETNQNQNVTLVPRSPCPDVFQYELNTDKGPPARWYGVINLYTDTTLKSLMLNIVLDRKADIIGNWIGEITSTDNIDFKIENTTIDINAGTTTTIRFFVQYNALNPTPKLQIIKLNSRDICNAKTPKPVVVIPDSNDEPINNKMPNKKLVIPKSGIRNWESEAKPIQNTDRQSNHVKAPSKLTSFSSPGDGVDNNRIRKPSNSLNTKPKIDSQAQCGSVVLNNNVTLVNGKPTLEGQWPWQIALYKTVTVNVEYICGGTLVSHRHVISAAHCVTKKKSTEQLEHNILTVYFGKHNLKTSNKGVQIEFVKKIIVHPEYTVPIFSHDVAILELQEPIKYTNWVRPVCLWPEDKMDLNNVIGKTGSVVAWTLDDQGVVTEELALVQMPVVDQETCLRSHPTFFVQFTSNYTFCAGNRDGTSVCNGDSGGGMVFKNNGIWYLRGVVSVTIAKENGCDPSHYVVFTDIAKLLPWVKQNVYDY